METSWYALKVRTRSESAAIAALQYHGFESYAPQRLVRKIYCDRVKTVAEPVFPGYLFCRFHLRSKSTVLSGTGVEYIIGFGGRPASIADRELDAVRLAIDAGGQAAALPRSGQRVRIIAGSLAGTEGILIREANRNQFIISVPLLQRGVSVIVDQSLVQFI